MALPFFEELLRPPVEFIIISQREKLQCSVFNHYTENKLWMGWERTLTLTNWENGLMD